MAALLAAAAASATVFVAADLALLLPSEQADSVEFVLQTIGFLWPLSFAVAFVHAVGLGLPAYLLLRWRRLTAWWTGLAGGFLAGGLPYAVLAFPWGAPPANLVAAHIVAGFTWTRYAGAIAGLGALGMAGGIAAWLTWYWLGRKFARAQAAR
jgi:hypothetical protein